MAAAAVAAPAASRQPRWAGGPQERPSAKSGRPRPAGWDAAADEGEAPAARSVCWSLAIRHCAVSTVHVQLVASVVRVKSSRGFKHLPRCAVEVWAEAAGGQERLRLATTTGAVCPKNDPNALRVCWLGRLKECPLEARGGGGTEDDAWRYVDLAEEEADADAGGGASAGDGTSAAWPRPARRRRSLAQALLGVLARVGALFGMGTVELGAEDTGTGKLIQFYLTLGFVPKTSLGKMECAELPMRAPLEAVAALAPKEWLAAGLLPGSFDAWPWLWHDVDQPQVDCVLDYLGVRRQWAWKAEWPLGAGVEARLEVEDYNGRIVFVVQMRSRQGSELAYTRGALRLAHSSLRVLWLGRSGSQAVHPSVRGLPARAAAQEQGGGGGPTAAMALLGVLCVLARWFDCRNVEINALDNGSGRLIRYLQRHGFAGQCQDMDPQRQPLEALAAAGEPPALAASCGSMARRCCPEDWLPRLPPDAGLSPLARTVGRRC